MRRAGHAWEMGVRLPRGAAVNETAVADVSRSIEGPALESGSLTLRTWLMRLAGSDRMAIISGHVSLQHQLAAIAKRIDGQKAALFLKPGGHKIPVVSGFMSRR